MELLIEQHYVHHVLRMPHEDWPDPANRGFAHINPAIYVSMQGPSELGISSDASLAGWDRTEELARSPCRRWSSAPARHHGSGVHGNDGGRLPAGRYLDCPDGSHMAMYDDQRAYFSGLIEFLAGLDSA